MSAARKEKSRTASNTKYPVTPRLEAPFVKITEFTKPLNEVIRQRREELGLLQREVAAATLTASSEFVGMVEGGKRSFALNKIPALASILKLDQEDLCRLALFEDAPELAMTLFGNKVSDYKPRKTKGEAVTEGVPPYTPEQLGYHDRLWKLPTPLRVTILSMIDQFTVLVRGEETRLKR